jgi:PAS domain S-box-containing protein
MDARHDGAYPKLLMGFNAVPIATWSYDGGFLEVNDALLDLIGYSREEFAAGKISWRELTPPQYLPLDENCMRELETSPVAQPYVKEYVRKDGSRVAVRLHNGRDMHVPGQGIVVILPVR